MPLVALIVGTFAVWITAKGELGKYAKLATTRNTSAASGGPLQPINVVQTGGGNSVTLHAGGVTTNDAAGNSIYFQQLTP